MESLDISTTSAPSYPERGLKAYSIVLGAWLILFPASGLLNSTGIFQAWLLDNHLKAYSESEVAWIFSTFAFLFFFGGFVVGTLATLGIHLGSGLNTSRHQVLHLTSMG